ncbi:MAG TPA: PHB depolymerase family esterase [Polyangiaceae bacterium]|nr:PHB depolymerase family esterase [Polyangiaceae bacterium]
MLSKVMNEFATFQRGVRFFSGHRFGVAPVGRGMSAVACARAVRFVPPRLRERLRGAKALASRFGALLVAALLSSCRSEPPLPPGARELGARMVAGKLSRPGMAYELPYRLFVPAGYSAGHAYPLIVFLHASGSNGTDNLSQLTPAVGVLIERSQAVEPAFVLVPQVPESDKWVSGSVGPPFLNYRQSDRPQSPAAQLVLVGLDELATQYTIDPDRIYLTGVSAGGAGTWDLLTRNGIGRFAAAVPITGANDPSRAAVIARLPIWTFHGADDDVSPASNTREMVRNLRALGSPVRYTEYLGVGHNSGRRAYDEPELFPWLFAQRRGTDAARP